MYAHSIAVPPCPLQLPAGERIELELACEPSNIVEAVVELEQLQLPAQLAPPEGSLARWLRGGGCSLLEVAGPGLVKVSGTMHWQVLRQAWQVDAGCYSLYCQNSSDRQP